MAEEQVPIGKMLFIFDTYQTAMAGTEKQIYYLLNGLASRNIEIEIYLFRNNDNIQIFHEIAEIKSLEIRKIFSIKTACEFYVQAKKWKQDGHNIAHIYFNDAAILAPSILYIAGIKSIVSRRDMGFWYDWKNIWPLRFNSFFINRVVANCKAIGRHVSKKEFIPQKKIVTIYNGYQQHDKDSNESIYEEKFRDYIKIGLVGNLKPIKRIEDLISAFPAIVRKHEETVLVLIGGGDSSQYVRQAKKLGVDGKVIFLGQQEKIVPLIKTFNVGVLCSESEGCSNTIVEYMYNRVPVVCTDTGGNGELVINNETGFLVDVGDVVNLSDRILAVLDNPEKTAEIAERAFQHITSLCDMENMVEQHIKLYKELSEN